MSLLRDKSVQVLVLLCNEQALHPPSDLIYGLFSFTELCTAGMMLICSSCNTTYFTCFLVDFLPLD